MKLLTRLLIYGYAVAFSHHAFILAATLTSVRNCIQASSETAKLICDAGKTHWLKMREDKITTKGNARLFMQTYWVVAHGDRAGSDVSGSTSNNGSITMPCDGPKSSIYGAALPDHDAKMRRLIDWNAATLLGLLKQVVANRDSCTKKDWSTGKNEKLELGKMPLYEVKEIIPLPEFDGHAAHKQKEPAEVSIPQNVVEELHRLITEIAALYNDNPCKFECTGLHFLVAWILTRFASFQFIVSIMQGVSAYILLNHVPC